MNTVYIVRVGGKKQQYSHGLMVDLLIELVFKTEF